MKRPTPYEIDYRHDRRKHRHRCKACNKIINAGERVLMTRVCGGQSIAIHVHHADADIFPDSDLTWREMFQMRSDAYARRLGHNI